MVKGTQMVKFYKMACSASALAMAAVFASAGGAAVAQGAETELQIAEPEAEETAEVPCTEEVDCVEPEAEFADDEAGGVLPPEGATADDFASQTPVSEDVPTQDSAPEGEPVLVDPGSTDESNPGGSTRPGTTPDN
jgi:hypothetical protein